MSRARPDGASYKRYAYDEIICYSCRVIVILRSRPRLFSIVFMLLIVYVYRFLDILLERFAGSDISHDAL